MFRALLLAQWYQLRDQVERAFGTLMRVDGWRRVRYRGLRRDGAPQ